MEFSKDSVILNYFLSLSDKQLDELQETSDKIEEAKKTLEKVLVSEEEEAMYKEMMKETMTQVSGEIKRVNRISQQETPPQKTQRIRQRDQSRKIPMGKRASTKEDTVGWTNNKGPEATLATKITLTGNLQGPEDKHLQITIREWENPSDTEKEEIKRMGEEKEDPKQEKQDNSNKRLKVQFGSATTMEFHPIKYDTETYKDWSIFPKLFTSTTAAKIYESVNKHQNIGCGS